MTRLVPGLVALIALAMLTTAGSPRASAQQPPSVLTGAVPAPGSAGLLTAAGGSSMPEVLAALRSRGCEPQVALVRGAEHWGAYLRGAPDFVNASFPQTIPADSTLFVSCLAEFEVAIQQGDIVLAGTLSLPPVPGPYPGAITVTGTGPQDRNEATPGLPGYEPLRWIADELLARGVAVLRYDERGAGASTGQFAGATTQDFALDAEAVLEFLRQQPMVDASHAGIVGHSEGSNVAALVAARNPGVAFVVSLAGPGMDGTELLAVQNRLIIEGLGLPPEAEQAELERNARLRERTLAEDWEAVEALLREIYTEQVAALPEEERAGVDIDAIVAAELMTAQTWTLAFMRHDPAEDWAQVTVPVLALFGGLDVQVPAEENGEQMAEALSRAGNGDVTMEVFPSANHLFQPAVTGAPGEYAQLPAEFVPGVRDTIGTWVAQRFVTGS